MNAGPADRINGTMLQGAISLPYSIANVTVDAHATQTGVPVFWWRSVGATHNAYSTETFLDELAVAAGKDAVEFRLGLLAQQPLAAGVLKLAAEKAGWGRPAPAGLFRGIALHEWSAPMSRRWPRLR
jgi:isoquinoline 1-oxidoreductase subunit beta